MSEGGPERVRRTCGNERARGDTRCSAVGLLTGLSTSSPFVQMGRWPDGRVSRVVRLGLPSQAERADPGTASRIVRAGPLVYVSKKPGIN